MGVRESIRMQLQTLAFFSFYQLTMEETTDSFIQTVGSRMKTWISKIGGDYVAVLHIRCVTHIRKHKNKLMFNV